MPAKNPKTFDNFDFSAIKGKPDEVERLKNLRTLLLFSDNQSSKTEDGQTTSYTYDVFNRLQSVNAGSKTASYAYQPDGLRLSKTANGQKTTHIRDGE